MFDAAGGGVPIGECCLDLHDSNNPKLPLSDSRFHVPSRLARSHQLSGVGPCIQQASCLHINDRRLINFFDRQTADSYELYATSKLSSGL